MKLKPCDHPSETVKAINSGKAAWCRVCGAITLPTEEDPSPAWEEPLTMTDPKRYVVSEAGDLPPYADRRAWEMFAAEMLPSAVALVAQDATLSGSPPEEKYRAAQHICGLMADGMIRSEWLARFGVE